MLASKPPQWVASNQTPAEKRKPGRALELSKPTLGLTPVPANRATISGGVPSLTRQSKYSPWAHQRLVSSQPLQELSLPGWPKGRPHSRPPRPPDPLAESSHTPWTLGGAVVPALASAAGLPSIGAAAAPCPEGDSPAGPGDDPGVCPDANPTANIAVQENKKPVLICVPCIEGSPLGRQP